MLPAVETLAVIAVVLAVAAALIPLRRQLIRRSGGTFDCAVRFHVPTSPTSPAPGERVGDAAGWSFAIGRYHGLTIELFRVFSYSPRPRTRLSRRGFDVSGRRDTIGEEIRTLLPGWSVLKCVVDDHAVELAMSPESMMGFLTWVEAAPPGWNTNQLS